MTDSARAAGVARPHVYEWKRDDPAFAAAWDDALEQAADVMEREALRRAVEGTEKPIFGSLGYRMGSGKIGQVREYSDTLLIFLLKGARPEKYRERNEITGSGGGPIVIRQFTDALNTAYAADDPDNTESPTE